MIVPPEMQKIIRTLKSTSCEVVGQMTRLDIKEGKDYIKRHTCPSYDYSFIIGVTGKYKGAVTMSLTQETAFCLVSAMLGNKPVNKLDEMAESALRELANMTVARSFSSITDGGNIDITPPTFVRGTGVSFAVADVKETYVTTLNTPAGDIEFNISLQI